MSLTKEYTILDNAESDFNHLKSEGHAVELDVVKDYKRQITRITIHHYLTCAVCAREKDTKRETTS